MKRDGVTSNKNKSILIHINLPSTRRKKKE